MIRTGRDEARVEAILELPAAARRARARLVADGREVEEGLVVRRVIARGGRGRAHLGGGLATAADLAATVAGLIDIASQHDQQSLTDPESQLAILDAFAENQPLRDEMAAAHAAQDGRGGGAGGLLGRRARARRARGSAALPAGRARGGAAGAGRGRGAAPPSASGSRGPSASSPPRRAARRCSTRATARSPSAWPASSRELAPLAALDPALAPLVERLGDAQAAIEDVARDLGRYARGIRSDPARLAEVEERLFLLQRLCRKHGGTVADLGGEADALRARAGELGSFEEGLAARQAAAAAADAARGGGRGGAQRLAAAGRGRA